MRVKLKMPFMDDPVKEVQGKGNATSSGKQQPPMMKSGKIEKGKANSGVTQQPEIVISAKTVKEKRHKF